MSNRILKRPLTDRNSSSPSVLSLLTHKIACLMRLTLVCEAFHRERKNYKLLNGQVENTRQRSRIENQVGTGIRDR